MVIPCGPYQLSYINLCSSYFTLLSFFSPFPYTFLNIITYQVHTWYNYQSNDSGETKPEYHCPR